jgi:tetratricopeptide (TPR) repeat protein
VAGELYQRALAAAEHLERPPGEVATVWEALGDVAERYADYEQAADAYEHAGELAGGDAATEVRLMVKRGVVCERGGHYDDAIVWHERGLAEADNLPDEQRAESLRAHHKAA